MNAMGQGVTQNEWIKASLYFYSPFYKVMSTDSEHSVMAEWLRFISGVWLMLSSNDPKDSLLWSSLIRGEYSFIAVAWWVFALEKLWDFPLHGCVRNWYLISSDKQADKNCKTDRRQT